MQICSQLFCSISCCPTPHQFHRIRMFSGMKRMREVSLSSKKIRTKFTQVSATIQWVQA